MAEAGRPARSRLSRSAEFDRVYRQGRSTQHRLLVLYRFQRPEDTPNLDADGPASRIGVTVSKKIGTAVVRNRLKRQLRSVLQVSDQLDSSCDYVAIAKPGLAELAERDHEEFTAIITDLVTRLATTTAAK